MTSRVFWDASALVKTFIQEDGTANAEGASSLRRVRGFLTDCVALEVLTTLAKKRRSGQITRSMYREAVDQFKRTYPGDFDVLELEPAIHSEAHRFAEKYHSRGTGAMDLLHLATARHLAAATKPFPVVLLSSDQALVEIAREEGLHAYNPEREPQAALRRALRIR